MASDSSHHRRRSIRLPDYDYAQPGLYFVTICTHGRACLLGTIEADGVRLSAAGQIVEEEWLCTPEVRPNVVLDVFVIMPNHVHLLFGFAESGRRGVLQHAPTGGGLATPSQTIGAVVRGYKGAVTKRIKALRRTPGAPVWQRNYYERVVRDEREADRIRRYIIENPLRWHLDRYHPARNA